VKSGVERNKVGVGGWGEKVGWGKGRLGEEGIGEEVRVVEEGGEGREGRGRWGWGARGRGGGIVEEDTRRKRRGGREA